MSYICVMFALNMRSIFIFGLSFSASGDLWYKSGLQYINRSHKSMQFFLKQYLKELRYEVGFMHVGINP